MVGSAGVFEFVRVHAPSGNRTLRFLSGRFSTPEIFTPYFSTDSGSRFSVHSVTIRRFNPVPPRSLVNIALPTLESKCSAGICLEGRLHIRYV
jgi:hypothetical protein